MRPWWSQRWSRPKELDGEVGRAGVALACAYSNSHEYESALIAERRSLGVYGPRRHRRKIAMLGATAVVLVLALLAI